MKNPYEPPQQTELSRQEKNATTQSDGVSKEKVVSRIIRKYLFIATILLPIFSGVTGVILNPKNIWNGNSRTRLENFVEYTIPYGMGFFSLIFWGVVFVVILIVSFIRPLMRIVFPFVIFMGIVGGSFIAYGVSMVLEKGDGPAIAPMFLSVGFALIVVAGLSGRELMHEGY